MSARPALLPPVATIWLPARSPARWTGYTCAMIVLRLSCSAFWVDVRLREINGRWIASADTPDGPSLGLGELALEAIEQALGPFERNRQRAARQRSRRTDGIVGNGRSRPQRASRGERECLRSASPASLAGASTHRKALGCTQTRT